MLKKVLLLKVIVAALLMTIFIQLGAVAYAKEEIGFIEIENVTPPIIGESVVTEGVTLSDYTEGITITDVKWYDGDTLLSGDTIIEKGQSIDK